MSSSASQLLPILSAGEMAALGEHVFCDDEIALAWTRVERLPEQATLLRINARNETALRALAMLEEHDQSQADAAERAELHRLEGKLDLALELLSELVKDRHAGIRSRPVRFNSRGLCWDSHDRWESGTLLSVDCYALPPWPLPLKLHVRVVVAEPGHGTWRVCTRIESLTDGATEWLGKLVFRRHRRTIALQRSRE